jgi:hypothetical protein
MGATAQERGAIATQTESRNQCGRAIAMTLANPIKPGRSRVLRFNFWLTRSFPPLLGRLRKLSFIHFLRWTIVSEFPFNGPPQEPEQLEHEYLFFVSNYNGYWMQYIDAFYSVVPDQMDWIWGNTYGYPKGQPAGATKRVIRQLEFTASHYYSAYPEASSTMIVSALELKRRFTRFDAEVRDADPERFAAAYRRFVTDAQGLL